MSSLMWCFLVNVNTFDRVYYNLLSLTKISYILWTKTNYKIYNGMAIGTTDAFFAIFHRNQGEVGFSSS